MEDNFCEIKFLPSDGVVHVAAGTLLSAAADEAGVRIGRHCGGAGVCGKCRVVAGECDPLAPISETEKKALNAADINAGMRLSCCARVVRDGVVTVVDEVESAGHSILDGFSDAAFEWAPDTGGYGVAVDIGTTTVVCYLFDLDARRELDKISFLNPQVTFGDDVISRIAYSSGSDEALEKIQSVLTSEMDKKIGELAEQNGLQKEDIMEIVIAANTVMEHLFAGVSPASIGRSPYTPAFLALPPFRAADIGIKINEQGMIKMLPNVAGYVGSDIVAGVAALGMEQGDGVKLLIDIGTNSEIVISGREGLFCCATAAGPAFEGARIQYGMRASTGAIEKVWIEDGELRYKTIGGAKAAGLCGSGLIDAIAVLLREGVIDQSGRFAAPEKCSDERFAPRLGRNERGMVQILLTDEESPIYLTQKDVREVQLAIGAIKAGTEVMLEREGVTKDSLSEVYLAGAFGNYINIDSAAVVGLIPDIERTRIRGVKNSSGLGASLALASASFCESTKAVAEKMKYVELSSLPDFQTRFINAVSF